MTEIENKIKEILMEDIELPYKYKYTIRNALKKDNKETNFMKNKMFKILATGTTCLVVATSVVFAKDVSNVIQNFFNNSKGIDKAIEEGYIYEPNAEYISSEEIETKIENIIMDDFNLSFTIKIKLSEGINTSKIERVLLPNIIVTDDENRILFCENKEKFDDYCEINNLNYNYKEFNENYINSGSNYYIKNKDNEIDLVYNLYANIYPKSKKISIDFSQINLLTQENSESNEMALIGKWNMNVDIPSQFYNREAMLYKVKKCSKENINITEAEIYNTCMKFGLTIQENKLYDEGDSEEVRLQKIQSKVHEDIETAKLAVETDNYENVKLFDDYSYVETADGKKYYASESSSEDSGYSADYMSGMTTYWQTFNLTKYEATKDLKVYLKYKGEDIWIELER